MTDRLEVSVQDGVAELVVNAPPANTLTREVREELLAAVEAAVAGPDVAVILIRAAGKGFPTGADLRAATGKAEAPSLGHLCRVIELSPKPVIAAIAGNALGAGFELALAAHFRLAESETRFGFPEIALGLVPGAGGTQRLPRLIGAARTLDLLLSGRPLNAVEAERIGLIDKAVEGDLLRAARGTARNMVKAGTPPRPTSERRSGMRDAAGFMAAIRDARSRLSRDRRAASHAAIDCVEAALLLPIEAGLTREAALHDDLAAGDEARALRHVFTAERRAAHPADLEGVRARSVKRVGLIGGGGQTEPLTLALLMAGCAVTLVDSDEDTLEITRRRIEDSLSREVDAGRMPGPSAGDALSRLEGASRLAALGGLDLVIEALPRAALRRTLFERLGDALPDALLVSAEPEADLVGLGEATGSPDKVLGLHFMGPAHRNRLLEILPGPGTGPEALATIHALARRLEKVAIRLGDTEAAGPGLIADTVAAAGREAADRLVLLGARIADVDAAMRAYGFAAGPFEAADARGLAHVPGKGAGGMLDRMRARGWSGRAAGQGFYAYGGDGAAPRVPDEMELLIEALRSEAGIKVPRRVSASEVRLGVLTAMANAGAQLLLGGVATTAGDIDIAAIHGHGFPREKGGPMMVADLTGALKMRERLRSWALSDPFWEPSDLWLDLIRSGRRLGDWGAEALSPG